MSLITQDIKSMTAEEKIALLESCCFSKREADSLEEQLERQRAKVESCTAALSPTTCSGGNLPRDRIGDYIALWEEIFDSWQSSVQEHRAKVELCEAIISELPEKYQIVMRLRYIDNLKLAEVAKRLNYSYQWVRELAAGARNFF